MFSPNSRYATAGTYTLRTANGGTITATRLPIRNAPALRGIHPRTEGQRLDQIAAHYLGDATTFWRLCDASDGICPDAVGARDAVAIPEQDPSP